MNTEESFTEVQNALAVHGLHASTDEEEDQQELWEMPTETRGRVKQTIYKYNGRRGASTADTDHAESNETHSPENYPYQSLRSQYAPNSVAKSANPDSNGTSRRRRSTLLPPRPSDRPAPTDHAESNETPAPTDRPAPTDHAESNETPAPTDHAEYNETNSPENNPHQDSSRSKYAPNSGAKSANPDSSGTSRRRRSMLPPSRSSEPSDRAAVARLPMKDVISLYQQIAKQRNTESAVTEDSDGRRSSHGSKPRAGGRSKSAAFDHREESLSTEELFEVPVDVFFGKSLSIPADKYIDFPQKQPEGRRPHLKDLNRRPSTADGPTGGKAHGDRRSLLPAFEEMRRSSSFSKVGDLAKPSAGDRKSPARPSRRQTFAHRRSSSGGGGGSSSNSGNPNLKLKENPRFISSTNSSSPIATTIPSSAENGKAENYSRAKNPTIDSWKVDARAGELPATFASMPFAMSSHARHDDTVNGSLNRQKDVRTADFGGRLYRRSHSMSRRFRQEDFSDLAADLGQRSMSARHEHGSHLTSRRLESSNGSYLPSEDPINYTHVHGKQGGTGGNLSKDSRASGTSGRTMSSRTTLDVESRSESHRSASKRQPGSHRSTKVSIKGVAAAWYNRGWLLLDEMENFPKDIAGFNKFLSDCKSELDSGVPGTVLTVVLGTDSSDDVGSIVSTIVYAYFLSCTGSKENSKCFVPVINMRQEDFVLHTEAVWLFKVTGVDTSKFIFVDQISLQSYHRFGNLNLVLVDHSRLAPHQESFKEAVIEIVDNNVTDELYEWVLTRDIQEVGSCCTIIAERFAAEAPEHLAGHGLSRLLLGPILLETANLDANSARCTSRDECMAALLLNGAGRYGRQGFFRLLKKIKFDISLMSTMDMLRKYFKKWTAGPGTTNVHGCKGRVITIAMSTVGVPIWDVLNRKDVLEDLKRFQKKFKLDLHLVVTGYYDIHDRYKREILLVPEDRELIQHVETCFSAHEEALQLSVIHINGLPEEILVFRQGEVTTSRTVLRQILEDHFAM